MLIYLGFILVVAFCADLIRRSKADLLEEEYRYKLYALRDQLRELAMDGRVSDRSWLFGYLDSSIARTIKFIPKFTLWRVITITYAYKDDEQMRRAMRHLGRELSKPDNYDFAQIHREYNALMMRLLFERHLMTIALSGLTLTAVEKMKNKIRRSATIAAESPEASTLMDYCPA